MYKALYRTERPETLSEVIGQEHIVRVIKNQLKNDKVAHAYLFCGTRGTGKTTLARLLAKGVNCTSEGERPCGVCENCRAIQQGNFIDLVEVDAASNNGVDYIRDLRDSVNYPPAVSRKKIYIIDEVHMLSNSAFNAFLKTLEEPPEHVIFILATTDPQRIPQTILSRCIRFDFKRVPENLIMEKMMEICEKRNVAMDEEAIRLLASNADGSVRDGLSLLEQCLAGGDEHITRDMVLEFLGAVSQDFFIDLTEKVLLHNAAEGLTLLNDVIADGKDPKLLLSDWLAHYRSLLITKFIQHPENMLNMSGENIERLKSQSSRIDLDEINLGIVTLSKTINDAKYSTQPRILMELAIVTLASGLNDDYFQIPKHRYEKMQGAGGGAKSPHEVKQDVNPQKASSNSAGGAPIDKSLENGNAKQAEPLDDRWAAIMGQAEIFEQGYDETGEVEEFYPIPDELENGVNNSPFGDEKDYDEGDTQAFENKENDKAEGFSEEYMQKLAAIASSASEFTDEELDEMWKRVMNRAMETKPSLFVALQGSALLHLSEKDIRVSLRADYALAIIEPDRELIADLIEEESGIHGFVNFKVVSQTQETSEENASDVAREIKDEWGFDVKIR